MAKKTKVNPTEYVNLTHNVITLPSGLHLQAGLSLNIQSLSNIDIKYLKSLPEDKIYLKTIN